MNIISIDLGTTNIKVSVYDQKLNLLDAFSHNVRYDRTHVNVEFDPSEYFSHIWTMVRSAASAGKQSNGQNTAQIVLTGQAESLVILGPDHTPVYPGISWMDMRSSNECAELAARFDAALRYRITGQPALSPTWPITKILWLKHHHPDIFQRTSHYLLLKDYVAFCLSGTMAGDYSIYSFSHYFNIISRDYWQDILDYCGVRRSQLPKLVLSGSVVGTLLPNLADPEAGLTPETKINIGTLDHFAGMIGTGSIFNGQISESAGTVLSIAAFVDQPLQDPCGLPVYCGPFQNSYVLLPVCESGGFSMEWYKKHFLKEISFEQLNQTLGARKQNHLPIFLPYLTGVAPPDFNPNTSGVFFGIRAEHDEYDLALSVMYGVACLLQKNLAYMRQSGIPIKTIISTGGGAKSPVWCQIKADITGLIVEVPDNEEAPSLGAAIMAAVSEKQFASYEDAIHACVSIKHRYKPSDPIRSKQIYQTFCSVYDGLASSFELDCAT